ncbi:hypothetical protein ABPG73_020152 [Tetrahymena malaccensis]
MLFLKESILKVVVIGQKLKSQKSLITKENQQQHDFQKFQMTYGKLVFLLCIFAVFGKKLKSSKSLLSNKNKLQHDFQKFKKTYGKSYDSQEQESYIFNVFLENLKEADKLNRENPSAKFGITQFSDQTKEEFLNLYANANLPRDIDIIDSFIQNTSGTDSQVESYASLPTSWDIRVDGPGKLQPVKNQGFCGSCWAFAITSTVENLYSIKQNLNLNLSEQQQVDCVYNRDGCTGGWADAYDYVKKTGLAISSRYPYTGYSGSCRAQQVGQLYKISSYKNLPNDSNAIKQALVNNGALAVVVDASNWGSYQGGILSNQPLQINKFATIIGYGSNYWLLRNTWGTNWGEQGHIRVANNGTGGIALSYAYQPYL